MCGTAESAEAALDMPGWAGCDLLVTGVSLGGMDGIALAERKTAERPGLPGVVTSVDREAGPAERAREAGARAILTKDTVADTLVATLRDALQSEATSN